MDKEERKAFEEAAEPLMKYLAQNHHPHITVVVTATHAELVEGVMTHVTLKYIKD